MADETKAEDVKVEDTAQEAAPATETPAASATAEAKADKDEKKEEGAEVEVPAKFKSIVEEIEKMSVLDLHELVKVFEAKFGVSAAAVAAAPAGGAAGDAGAAEEKSTFTVELAEAGSNKIAVIKAVKEALALGLKDAKDKVDGAPSVLAEGMKKEEAETLKKAIEDAGGKVNLK